MADSESPWVLELSSGTFRSGFASPDKVTDFARTPCSAAPPEVQAAGSGRTVADKESVQKAVDWVASTTGAGAPSRLTVVLPSGCGLRRQREIARAFFESGRIDNLLLVHAASAHAVGAGLGSAVVVDAGQAGSDACFAGPAASVGKDHKFAFDWSGSSLTALVGDELGARSSRRISQAEAAAAKEALACLRGGEPAGEGPFVLPDGTELDRRTYTAALRPAVDAAWADASAGAVDAVRQALASAEGEGTEEVASVLLSGAASRLPGWTARVAADLAAGLGRRVRVVRSATAESNGFLGGFFLSATSMYAGKLSMTKKGFEEEGVRHLMLGTGGQLA